MINTSCNDVYNKQIQDDLLDMFKAGQIREALSAGIKIHDNRSAIMNGLYNRTQLQAATAYLWNNPREADGVPIYARTAYSSTKENHKLHTPFDRVIAMQKSSYMVGIMPEPNIDDENIQETINDRMLDLNFSQGLNELVQKSAGRGNAFALLSSPKGTKEAYIIYPDEWSCFLIYDTATGKPVYGVRYWYQKDIDSQEKIKGELYDNKEVSLFEGDREAIKTLSKPIAHLFNEVPLIEFPNNTERLSDVELTISLQDAFDIADSDLSSEVSQLRLAYLALFSDELDIDGEFVDKLKQTGIILSDGKFIEKNLNASAVENLKTDLERRIYKYSNSYNADELGSDKALTAFQIQQKLIGLESSCKETEMIYKTSLNRLFKILFDFYQVNIDGLSWTFSRNTPRNILEDLKKAVESNMRFSQDTLSKLMPFEFDQKLNKEQLEEEKNALGGEFNLSGEIEEDDIELPDGE